MSNSIADIHVSSLKTEAPKGAYVDDSLGKWFRPTLALAIEERGLKAVFSRGQDAYDFDNGEVRILDPKIEKVDGVYRVTVTPSRISLEGIRAIRNIAPVLGSDVPELNDPQVRGIARDKASTNNLLASIGLSKDYSIVDASLGIEPALEAVRSGNVILKPRFGKGGQGIFAGSKSHIARKYKSVDRDQDWLIEEALDLSAPMPLKGENPAQQELIDTVNKNGLAKELRIYTFGRDGNGNLVTSAVLRAAMPGDQSFGDNLRIYIDQNSVPQAVLQGTDDAAYAFERTTGVKEMHLAIDWALVKREGDEALQWIPMEVNGTEPVLVYENENENISKDQASKLAEQLYRVAQNRSTREVVK